MWKGGKIMENTELIIDGVDIKKLIEILKSDSVYTLLRFGAKNPSKSGMDCCEDNFYYDLYQIVNNLIK